MLLSNEWYYENTAGIILTKKGKEYVLSQLKDTDVCPKCGAKLTVIGMMEGTFVVCSTDIYHKFGRGKYEIDYGDFTTPPMLIRP